MAGAVNAREVVLWTDADRVKLLGEVLDVMGSAVAPIGVGGPRAAPIDRFAQSLDCPREDDLRKLLVDHPAAFLLLGTRGRLRTDELLTATSRGTVVLTLEPVAAELSELASLEPAGGGIVHIPAFAHSPGAIHAADPQQALGGRRTLAYGGYAPGDATSLFAQLLDAWTTVLLFAELPESIDASLVGPDGGVPDTLRDITGIVSAHARTRDASAAVVQVADRAGDARRTLHVLSEQAELGITDTGYELRHADGSEMDRADESPEGITLVDLIAAQWRGLIDRPPPQPPSRATEGPRSATDALACCLACLLSARTAEPESPRNLLQMAGI